MALVELTMPALGEGIMEATVLKWLKQPGDPVEEEEPILEIATDKVDSEVPATAAGIIREVFFKENDVAPIGATIAIVETNHDSLAEQQIQQNNHTPAARQEKLSEQENEIASAVPYVPADITESQRDDRGMDATLGSNNGFYSPLVLSIAKQEGIDLKELSDIPGSGKEGRLSKNDLLDYLQKRPKPLAGAAERLPVVQQQAPAVAGQKTTDYPHSAGIEIIEMDRTRKLIAHHMKESQNLSATVTSFAEADVTNMVNWRNKIKDDFEKQEGTKITFTPMFIECVARVIKRFPLINSSIDGDKIILKKDINIGMATALTNGNLIVPVIKNVDHLNIVGLTKAVNTIANNARNNQLKPADTQEGTFTITNVGSFGSITGTPIINQPQVAILAVGTIKKRPVVVETTQGDSIAIRSMMVLSLSYDHRIIDGALGSTFLNEIVKEIEAWDTGRKI